MSPAPAAPRLHEEHVVLLDEHRRPRGALPKSEVHGRDTPLHYAFSAYGLDRCGRVLLTRRALGKAAWPGVWSGTVCGHPAPGEALEDAVARRFRDELGMQPSAPQVVLPDFAYRAVDPSGIVENEVCPVLLVCLDGEPDPAPLEVVETRWVTVEQLVTAVEVAPFALSPWCVLQVTALRAAGVLAPSTTG